MEGASPLPLDFNPDQGVEGPCSMPSVVDVTLACPATRDHQNTPPRKRQAHEFTVAWSMLHCARRGLDKNIVSTTAPERAVLSVMSLGVALRTDESGASEAAETFIFLASILLAFAGHVVLFWLNSACFEVGLIRTVIDNVTGSQ